jgi:hypothetical protein
MQRFTFSPLGALRFKCDVAAYAAAMAVPRAPALARQFEELHVRLDGCWGRERVLAAWFSAIGEIFHCVLKTHLIQLSNCLALPVHDGLCVSCRIWLTSCLLLPNDWLSW